MATAVRTSSEGAASATSSASQSTQPAATASSLASLQEDLEANMDANESAAGTSSLASRFPMRRMATDNTEIKVKAAAVQAAFKRPATWVLIFGWTLAICAGIVNATTYQVWRVYTSHMTGMTTTIGLRIQSPQGVGGRGSLLAAVAMVLSFLAGACACGFLIDKNHVHFGGKAFYGVALMGNALLLVLGVLLDQVAPLQAMCFVAAACGLQNAMCTSHFGAVVRTTHVTGTLTDIGSNVGRMAMIVLRKAVRHAELNALERAEVAVDARKLLVLVPMWTSFLIGSTLGAFLSASLKINALYVPAFVTFVLGVVYATMRGWLKTQLKGLERERLGGNVAEVVEALARTRSLLQAFQEGKDAAVAGMEAEEVVEDLDHEFGEMLEAVRDVEADLSRLYARQRTSEVAPGGRRGQPATRAGTTAF